MQTTFAQVAADALGIDAASIIVEQTDTSKVTTGTGTFQSRSSVAVATAAHRAARQLREAILDAASYRLDQPVEHLAISGSKILVDGQPAGLTLAELGTEELDVEVTYDAKQASHPYATHVCQVEIDRGSEVYVICRSGRRSDHAARALAGAGWRALNVSDGMIGWQAAGRPMTSESGQPFVA